MAYVRVPPDGSGKKIQSVSHTIGSDQVETQVVHLSHHENPDYFLHIDNRGSAFFRFAEGQPTLGGFGGLKTTSQRALGVYENSQGSYDDLFSVVEAVGGVSSYDDTAHYTVLTTTTSSGSRVFRTTNRYHYYLPGSANLIVMTIGCGDSGKTNNIRRWGLFDESDGLFFSLEDTTLYAVIRSSTSGSIVEDKVAITSWNVDKLDGTGLSGHTIDLSKINVFWIDYQWLGAGRVRFGIYLPDGSRLTCHQFENAGAKTVPYCRTGTLPYSSENINTGLTASPTILKEICIGIYTEGTYEDYTFWRSSDLELNNIAITGSNTLISCIRSKNLVPGLNHHNSIVVYPEKLGIYVDIPCRLSIHQGVDVTTTGSWGITDSLSPIEASTDSIATLSRPFHTTYLSSGVNVHSLVDLFEYNDEGILLNADGTAEVWALSCSPLGGYTSGNITLTLNYKEFW